MEFGICGGAWNQHPTDTQRQLKVWGSQKLHLAFQLYWGSVPLTPMLLFKGQLYLDPQLRQNSMLKFLFRENRETSPATNPSHLLRLQPQYVHCGRNAQQVRGEAWGAPAGARP